MKRNVPFVTPETNFEAVVSIMLRKTVEAVPVLDDGRLAGIICDDDMFRAFAEITGLREKGLRLSLKMRRSNDPMPRIAEILETFGEDILGVLTFTLPDKPEYLRVMFQVRPESAPEVLRFFESRGYQTEDLMRLLQNVFAN
jgi:acetoin utilization protein AcuB